MQRVDFRGPGDPTAAAPLYGKNFASVPRRRRSPRNGASRELAADRPAIPLADVIRELDLDLEEPLYRRSIVDIWQPVPEEQMHRSDNHAYAVHSPWPGSVAVVAMDDRGTTCGVYLDPSAARAVSGLLRTAADRAEGEP